VNKHKQIQMKCVNFMLSFHQAPTIVIPQDLADMSKPSLVLDLGHLKLSSDLSIREASIVYDADKSKSTPSLTEDYFYDAFELTMTNMTTLLTNDVHGWRVMVTS